MPSPAIGITGDVTLPTGFAIGVKSGTLTLSVVPVDVTTTADLGNQRVVGGLRRARGSAVGLARYNGAGTAPGWGTVPSTSTAMQPAAGVFKVVGASNQYSFNMLVTNIRLSFNYAGQQVCSFDYESDGPIVETWS